MRVVERAERRDLSPEVTRAALRSRERRRLENFDGDRVASFCVLGRTAAPLAALAEPSAEPVAAVQETVGRRSLG